MSDTDCGSRSSSSRVGDLIEGHVCAVCLAHGIISSPRVNFSYSFDLTYTLSWALSSWYFLLLVLFSYILWEMDYSMHMGHDSGHSDMDMGGQCNMNASTLRITN